MYSPKGKVTGVETLTSGDCKVTVEPCNSEPLKCRRPIIMDVLLGYGLHSHYKLYALGLLSWVTLYRVV